MNDAAGKLAVRPAAQDQLTEIWPELPLANWAPTYETLHMWLQIVGKIRLAHCALINHWWNVTLLVTPTGLTTGSMPAGLITFQIDLDFHAHELYITTSRGERRAFPLKPMSVSAFYAGLMDVLKSLGIDTAIWPVPVEVPEPIPFASDTSHASYDPVYAHRCSQILLQSARVFELFRTEFIGKVSPVHFFWGSFDLAVTRFSGRKAPRHPGAPNVADFVTREAYSHEVSSLGFWPGGPGLDMPVYYSYAYPEPPGYAEWPIKPEAAYYHPSFREFILPYDAVRTAEDPVACLLEFAQSSYLAAVDLGAWDRKSLERDTIG